MSNLYLLAALFLLLVIACGMYRILAGPTHADRMLAPQLFGTCGIAILLLLAKAFAQPLLLDIAIVFAILAVLCTMTFVRRTWYAPFKEEESDASSS